MGEKLLTEMDDGNGMEKQSYRYIPSTQQGQDDVSSPFVAKLDGILRLVRMNHQDRILRSMA